MSGFTDRRGLADVGRGFGGAADRPTAPAVATPPTGTVTIVCRLVAVTARAVQVFDRSGVSAWLPRALIRIEDGGALAALTPGSSLRITLPAWKAAEAGLSAVAGAGQGRLV